LSPRRVRSILLACVAVPAAIIAGCGGGGGGGGADVGPAAAAPADAPIYVDATVKPTGTAASDAKAALGKVLNTSDPGAKIVSLFNKSVSDVKPGQTFTYQQDVAPWLGNQVGLFATSFGPGAQPTILLESTSDAAAMASERKDSRDLGPGGSYKGHPYDKQSGGLVFGTAGGFAIYGPLAGFQQAVDAIDGESLGDSSDFKDAIGDLPDDRLGTFYTVPKTLIDALGPSQIDPASKATIEKSAGDQLDNPVSGALTATSNSFNLDFIGGSSVDTPESSLLGDVPSQAWLALGIGNLGNVVKREIDQFKDQIPNFDAAVQQIQATTGASLDQLEGSLGDAVIYVQGTSQQTVSGALVVQAKNADLTGRLLTQLRGLLQLGAPSGGIRPLQLSGGGTGFQINSARVAPKPIEIAQQGDKLVIGYGANSAAQSLSPASKLGDSPTFSTAKAQVSSLGTDFFLDIPSVLAAVKSGSTKPSPEYLQAKPYLDALSYLVTGTGSHGDQAELKAVLGLK
jgi:hypothetical protein